MEAPPPLLPSAQPELAVQWVSRRSLRTRILLHLFILLAVAYVLFFHHLGQRDLWSSHEARAAQDATTVLKEGQWLLPRLFDGRQELQKPPFYYWLAALFS